MESMRQLGDVEDSESPAYMCYKLRKKKIQKNGVETISGDNG